MTEELDLALFAEAARKSELCWVAASDATPRPLWHVWHDDAIAVVVGDGEQPDPGLDNGAPVRIVLRSKDKWTRIVDAVGTAHRLDPTTSSWRETADALQAKRLNAPDSEGLVERWRGSASLWRLSLR